MMRQTSLVALVGALFLLFGAVMLPAAPESQPATQPAPHSLSDGDLTFTPPADWDYVEHSSNSRRAAFFAKDRDGLLAIEVLPANAATSHQAGLALVRQLRQNHSRNNQQMVLTPRLEPDDRFGIRIHEQYKDKQGKTVDQLHLYRDLGGRAAMITIQSLSTDPAQIRKVHKVGEDMLLSARWKGHEPPVKKYDEDQK